MHQADYDVLTRALAAARREALARGQRSAARQVEETALVIAGAFAGEYRTFDPAKFMLAVCQTADPANLPAPVRRQLGNRFGTAMPRRRPPTAFGSRHTRRARGHRHVDRQDPRRGGGPGC